MVYEYVKRVSTHVFLSFSKQTYAVTTAVAYVVQAHGPRMPTTNARHAALGRGGTTHAAMKVIGCSCNNTLGNIKMTYQRRFGWSN